MHPDTIQALEMIDAAMFTGNPTESIETYENLKFYFERWTRELKRHKKDYLKMKKEQTNACTDNSIHS
jgi:hypothetical protein